MWSHFNSIYKTKKLLQLVYSFFLTWKIFYFVCFLNFVVVVRMDLFLHTMLIEQLNTKAFLILFHRLLVKYIYLNFSSVIVYVLSSISSFYLILSGWAWLDCLISAFLVQWTSFPPNLYQHKLEGLTQLCMRIVFVELWPTMTITDWA